MRRIHKIIITALLVVSLTGAAGCALNYKQLLQKAEIQEPELIKVEIFFSKDDHITAFVKSLGVEKDGQVYVGGASLNYVYDAQGRIIGSYNYSKVEYIKILE